MIAPYETLPTTTRVWIYQADQPFSTSAVPTIKEEIKSFVESWTSHNRYLKGNGDLLHDRFVILLVDESSAGASGCSIDKSVHFMKQLQAKYGVNLFDRMRFSYKEGENVKTVGREAFAQAYQNGEINDDTPVFDTLVKNKGELDEKFIKPLKESWHKRMV